MPYVLPLAAATYEALAVVGGKAASLGELLRAGLTVPPGFCLTTEAFRASKDGSLPPLVREELLAAFKDLQQSAAGAPGFAVRSSATAEDLPDASFAGIYKTVLGVRDESGLVEAVEACWRSAASAEAQTYLRERFGSGSAEMAVVVQALVPAEAAGVLFSAHPVTGDLDRAVVNGSWGLGEAVVASLVDGDTWVVRKSPFAVEESRIGEKGKQILAGPNGTASEQDVPAEKRDQPCLSEDQLRQLAAVAVKIERHYAFPQDIEWAFAGGRLYVLQSRAISTLQEAFYTAELHRWARELGLSAEPDALWARGTPLSALPLSPLYFSEMARFFTDMFGELARLRGETSSRRQDFRYYKGWSYINVAFGAEWAAQTPKKLLDKAWLPNLRFQLSHPRSLAIWATADHYYRLRDDVWLPEIARRRPDFATAEPQQIIDFIEFIERQRRERSVIAATGVDHGGTSLFLLTEALKRWAGEPDAESLPELTSGLPGSETHEENLAVWRLAQEALADPAVADTVARGDFGALSASPEGRRYLDAVRAFAQERPHRGTSDRDLMQPRWGDDPQMVLNQVRVFVRSGASEDPDAAHGRAAARRAEATRRVEAKVGRGPLGQARLFAFRRLLAVAQRYWVYRDNQRHSFDHYFYNLRRCYLALGDRLTSRGVLEGREDVFFLSKEEIYDLVTGKLSEREGAHRARWRRDWWRRCSQEEPPELLKGDEAYEPDRPAPVDGAGLQGVGGSSGRVTGTARVVPSIAGLNEVIAGEILVTRAIDPAWTPVFSLIAGVVSEEGGMLSHATVLAREYGIPAVIGLPGATRAIRTGDRISIDGSRGTVAQESPEES